MIEEARRPKARLGDAIASLAAISVALVFVFPIYWSFSQSLRNPLDTFTVAGSTTGSISSALQRQ
jgi:multiple sugar transport system permease protein